MDRLLATIVVRAMRRGMRGEPLWLAVGVGAWLVRRARKRGDEKVWSGRIEPGERLLITSVDPTGPGVTASAEG